MKKCLSLLMLAVFMAVLASACEDEDKEVGYYHSAPVFNLEQHNNASLPDYVDVEAETDYSNMTAYSDYEVYSKDAEDIKYYVKNNNPGKGFWLHMTWNNVELLDDEGYWVQLRFKYEDSVERCGFFFRKGDDGCVTATGVFNFSYLAEPLKAGEYRLLIYVGPETLYLPFTVE